MTSKTTLMRAGALGALIAVGFTATAEAAPAKKHHHHSQTAGAGSKTAALEAEVAALKSQVQALETRLDQQAAGQQQTAQTAQAAQAQAQAANERSRVLEAQTQTAVASIPAKVNTAVAALPKPKPGWEGSTSVSGRMYANVSNIEQKSNGAKIAPSGTGMDIKRFYVGIDHKFNDVYSANLTMDEQYSSAISSTEFFIKKAYLQAKFSDALTVRAGAADLPWIPFVEDVYGFRWVEQTVTDRTKFGTSSDWGVHALGKLANGKISYAVAVVDGAGYKAPLRSKGMDVEGRVSANVGPFVLGVGGYTGKLGKDVVGTTTFHTANRFNAIAAYVDPKFRLGVEYFSANDWTAVTSATADKADGWSTFGSFNIDPKTSIFAKWEQVKPNKSTVPSKEDQYYNLGISYQPVKIVDLGLVFKHDEVKNGSLATGNGTIGGSLGNKGEYNEFGVFTQVRW